MQVSNVIFFAEELGGGQDCEKQKSHRRFAQRKRINNRNLLGKRECVHGKKNNDKCPYQMAKY